MRVYPHGETNCSICGQVWVPTGYRCERVRLFPSFAGHPDPLDTPSPDDLNRWFKIDSSGPAAPPGH
ncbi:MAG: hypothetical protein EXS14_00200 [Planctomycetes bacterium]|nr:hypothetical protein [Planctomycetota bacterium]